MKRFMCVLIAALMLFTSGATLAYADDKEYSGGYEDKMTWSYDTETKTLNINCDGPLDFPYNMKYYEYYDMAPQKVLIYKEYPWHVNGFYGEAEHVKLSGNITEIGGYVFYSFSKLREIEIPETVTKIGDDAFWGNNSITSVTVPSGVKEIGSGAFSSMSNLESITLPDGLESLGGYAFAASRKLTDLTLPAGITHLGPRLFGTDYTTPVTNGVAVSQGGVMYSGEYALTCFGRDTEINIKDGTVLMADEMFWFAGTDPKTVTLPQTLRHIGKDCFVYSRISEITLPDGLETMGERAFYSTSISSVKLPAGITSLESSVFANTKLESIYLHSGISKVSADAFDNTPLKSVTVDKNNPYYCSQEGVLFNKNKTSIVVYPKGKEGKHYNIPATVKTLYTSFDGKLETVSFPKSIKNCYRRIRAKIYYFGTQEEFEKINIPPKTSGDYYDRITAKYCKAKLSKTRYLYNKKLQTPVVKVYDAAGNRLKEKVDYKVTLPSGRKKIGVYNIKVTLKGRFKGTFNLEYRIVPKGTELKKLTAGVSSFKVKWKRQEKNITGYQIQYSKYSSFSRWNSVNVFVSKPKATSKTIKNLSVDQKYYIRIRTYKTVGKNKVYSKWSKPKAVKVTRPF